MIQPIEKLAEEYANGPKCMYGGLNSISNAKWAFLAGAAAQREQDRAELERVREALMRCANDEHVGMCAENCGECTCHVGAVDKALLVLTTLLERKKP